MKSIIYKMDIELTITVALTSVYDIYSDIHTTLLKEIKKQYNCKCKSGYFIEKVNSIDIIGVPYIAEHNNDGNLLAKVRIVVTTKMLQVGDILVACKASHSATIGDFVSLTRPNMIIRADMNNLVSKVFKDEMYTLRAANIIYDENNEDIQIDAEFQPHSLVVPSIYKVNATLEDIRVNEKRLIPILERASKLDKKKKAYMESLMYPFAKEKKAPCPVMNIRDIIGELYLSIHIFNHPTSGLVCKVDSPKRFEQGGVEIFYNYYISQLIILLDMCESYDIKGDWSYYNLSKANNESIVPLCKLIQ